MHSISEKTGVIVGYTNLNGCEYVFMKRGKNKIGIVVRVKKFQ